MSDWVLWADAIWVTPEDAALLKADMALYGNCYVETFAPVPDGIAVGSRTDPTKMRNMSEWNAKDNDDGYVWMLDA